MTNNPILVTGGTGTLGRQVVPLLRAAGVHIRVLSRHGHESADGVEHVTCDLQTGAGLAPAVDGIDTILHLAGGPKGDDEATRNLVRAASTVGVRHLVYISVTAADRLPLTYFKSKYASEQIVADSGLPWTTLRAAQFHEFVLTIVEKLAKLPVVPVPGGIRLQPVGSGEVASRLVELTLAEPAGRVPDMVGPRVYPVAELISGYLAATGRRRLRLPIHVPGKVGRVYRAGGNLTLDATVPTVPITMGERTWEDFLTEHVRVAQHR